MTEVHDDFAAFAAALPAFGAVAGLDVGDRTVGVAVSDGLRTVATPLRTVRRKKFTLDAEAIEAMLADRAVCGVVIGLPLNMDGTEGPRCQSTRAFARNLGRTGLSALPVLLWDERWTTVTVERALIEQDVSRRRRAAAIDTLAAQTILQAVLDRLGHLRA